MSYDNTNRGQIWGNDKKEKDTQPDYKGSLNVNGQEFWVSAWKRKPDANPKAPALSFSVEPKEQQPQQPQNGYQQPQSQPQAAQNSGFDDSIPF